MKKNLFILLFCHLLLSNLIIAQPNVTTIPTGNYGYAISPSGNYVTGQTGTGCFIYNVDSATVQTFIGEEAWGVNDHGTVVGNYLDPNFQYQGVSYPIAGTCTNGVWSTHGVIPGFTPFSNTQYSHAYGISDDGSTISGMVWRTAAFTNSFTWNPLNGYVILDDLTMSSKAQCLSGDGKVAGGWMQSNTRIPCYWKPDSVILDPQVGETHAINQDGKQMVGQASGSAFLLSSDTMHYLTSYPGANDATALGLSENGIIVGFYNTGSLPPFTKDAFIYTSDLGMLNLRDYLISVNATNVPASINLASGISRDGKRILASTQFPSASYIIEFDTAITGISVPSKKNDWFYVSPNPVTEGIVNIKGIISDDETHIELRDITGREIFNMPLSDLSHGEFQQTIDLTEKAGHKLNAGIYMMSLVSSKNTITRKLNIY